MLGFGTLLQGTDWAEITDYLSPVFFQIVPPLGLASQLRRLTGSFLDRSEFNKACEEMSRKLKGTALPAPCGSDYVTLATPKKRGELVLELYFWQLLYGDTSLLDLRYEAFRSHPTNPSQLRWQPQPLYVRYEPAFVEAVRDLYLGFYTDSPARFAAALTALNLQPARELFLQHFGKDQRQQAFRLADFRATFHQIFLLCKRHRLQLQPNFLALGAGLFCLYQHLEKLGESFDVRASFERAAAS